MLTSLAHRALLQAAVSDNPEKRKRSTADAGIRAWRGLIPAAPCKSVDNLGGRGQHHKETCYEPPRVGKLQEHRRNNVMVQN